jgi:hypothetical protein
VHFKAPPPHLLQGVMQDKISILKFSGKISDKVIPWKMRKKSGG